MSIFDEIAELGLVGAEFAGHQFKVAPYKSTSLSAALVQAFEHAPNNNDQTKADPSWYKEAKELFTDLNMLPSFLMVVNFLGKDQIKTNADLQRLRWSIFNAQDFQLALTVNAVDAPIVSIVAALEKNPGFRKLIEDVSGKTELDRERGEEKAVKAAPQTKELAEKNG